MTVIICPGIHPPELTQRFLTGLDRIYPADLVFPADCHPAFSALHIFEFLLEQLEGRPSEYQQYLRRSPLLFIAFSAGVVGAIGAAHLWQCRGGEVKAFIALDGWGMPLGGQFPIYRLSHDHFTHWSSSLLGTGQENFYADPSVGHWDLWRSPHTTSGWRLSPQVQSPTTASEFLHTLLTRYGEENSRTI
jgi:hypothetical protein